MKEHILILVLVLGGLAQCLNAITSSKHTHIRNSAGLGVCGSEEDAKKRYEDIEEDRKKIKAPPDSPLENFNVLNFFNQNICLIFACY
jgi:hypothetical protein